MKTRKTFLPLWDVIRSDPFDSAPVKFRFPNFIRVEVKDTDTIIDWVSDGDFFWEHDLLKKTCTRYPAARTPGETFRRVNLKGLAFLFGEFEEISPELRDKCKTAKVDGEIELLFIRHPIRVTQDGEPYLWEWVCLRFEPTTNRVTAVEHWCDRDMALGFARHADGEIYSEFNANPAFAEEDFQFKVPEGVTVVEKDTYG